LAGSSTGSKRGLTVSAKTLSAMRLCCAVSIALPFLRRSGVRQDRLERQAVLTRELYDS
jgi:hypothetical protein